MAKRERKSKDEEIKVLDDIRPSDNFSKKDPPPHVEKRVTQKEIMQLQNDCDPDLLGYRPHKVNGIIPVDAITNEIKPAADGTIGTALFKPKKAKKKEEEDE